MYTITVNRDGKLAASFMVENLSDATIRGCFEEVRVGIGDKLAEEAVERLSNEQRKTVLAHLMGKELAAKL